MNKKECLNQLQVLRDLYPQMDDVERIDKAMQDLLITVNDGITIKKELWIDGYYNRNTYKL